MLLGGLYALFEGWAWTGWIVLALTPFVSAILPMEITDFLRRKKICEHIKRDFMEESEVSQDHTRFLAALHQERSYSSRRKGTKEWKTESDFPTVSSYTR